MKNRLRGYGPSSLNNAQAVTPRIRNWKQCCLGISEDGGRAWKRNCTSFGESFFELYLKPDGVSCEWYMLAERSQNDIQVRLGRSFVEASSLCDPLRQLLICCSYELRFRLRFVRNFFINVNVVSIAGLGEGSSSLLKPINRLSNISFPRVEKDPPSGDFEVHLKP